MYRSFKSLLISGLVFSKSKNACATDSSNSVGSESLSFWIFLAAVYILRNLKAKRRAKRSASERKTLSSVKQKGSFPNYSNLSPGWNFSKDMHEDAAGETSFVNSNKNYEMRSNPGIEGMRLSSVSNRRLHPYGGKVTSEQTDSWLHEYDDIRPKIVQQKEYLKSKPSDLILQQSGSCDDEGRGQLRYMAKMEEVCRERRAMREYSDPVGEKVQPTNEMRVAKRVRDESPPLDYAKKSSFSETPTWGNQIKGSAMEMPSSFSEDETAETSSSMD